MMYFFAGLAGVAAIVVFFVVEGKILALVLSGVAALFLVLQFTQEFNASSNATSSKIDAAQANFNLEWAKARDEDKKSVSALQERSSTLQAEADQAKANQKSVEAQNDAIREQLADALNSQVAQAAQDTAPPVSLKK